MEDSDFPSGFKHAAVQVLMGPPGREDKKAVEGGSLEFGEERLEGWFGKPAAERGEAMM